MPGNYYLLAVETAISGGSISLFKQGDLVRSRSGPSSVSRAEDLLPNVSALLEEANVSKHDLTKLAISLGPGSYTGLRIGIASVMGLARGLDIEYVGVPIFEALVHSFPDVAGFGLPMGKTDVCFALASEPDRPLVTNAADLSRKLEPDISAPIGVHSDLVRSLRDVSDLDLIDIGSDLARFVGAAAQERPSSAKLEAIYVQNPRFG